MSLATMQRDFQSWLVEASQEAADRLTVHGAAGLAVYQNNYRAQLVGCLENAFPQTRLWLGEDEFRTTTIVHIDCRPPHAWTLDAYAEHFGETLRLRFPDNPDLHELAWIERALSEAFVAQDAPPFCAQVLASIDWDSAQLRLTPTLLTHAVTTNVESIWWALCAEQTPPQSEMLAEAGGLLVWRRQFTSRLRQVSALEYQALLHLQHNGSFAELCQWLVVQLGEEQGVAKAGALLADWLGSELVIDVTSDAESAHAPGTCPDTPPSHFMASQALVCGLPG